MYHLLETMDRLHVSGFSLLEWSGVAAVVLLILAILILILKRTLTIPAQSSGPQDEPPMANGRAKILIVDDDPLILEIMPRLLGERGYRVVGVSTGEQAVDYMRKNGADLILLDLFIGEGIDGAETYRQIRAIRPFQRVIVLSGHATPEKVSALRRLGVEHYLIKPVPIATLVQAIRAELNHP